ncbi:MAG: hypothetical protein J5729_06235, partial [Bacteroidaceae bacterium]|nr:hypothetical protein [Bacteroidaceae bacterium]
KIVIAIVSLVALCGVATAQDVPAAQQQVSPMTEGEQVADTADNEPNVIGGRVDSTYLRQGSRQRKEQNVIGTPVYYDARSVVRPEHHYRNSLSSHYCAFFLEGETMIGPSDLGLGVNFTYLPKRWGAYASLLRGDKYSYLTAGPALRLSDYDEGLDLQLYGGLVFEGMHTGAEAGLRIAAPQTSSDFCWTSASLGMGVINGDVYATFGLSLDIVAIGVLTIFLF